MKQAANSPLQRLSGNRRRWSHLFTDSSTQHEFLETVPHLTLYMYTSFVNARVSDDNSRDVELLGPSLEVVIGARHLAAHE